MIYHMITHISLGTTVFCRTRNFEPSHGICSFPRNFYVFTEFCGMWPHHSDADHRWGRLQRKVPF